MENETGLRWRKSSFSGGAQQCVEVAVASDGSRYVRDTKDRTKAAHHYTAGEWDAFIKGVKAGEFD
jgi:hypothetical protein